MTKLQFLFSLRDKLSTLPQDDVEERLRFYSEMIEDRMEEGLSEEEAVSAVGTVDEISAQILAELPPVKLTKGKEPQNRKTTTREIPLVLLGSPIWLSLLIAAFAIILSLYISLWALIISLWAIFASLIGCFLGGIASGTIFIAVGSVFPGIAMMSMSLICAGLAIFLFFGCKAATKGTLLLAKNFAIWIKTRLTKKEDA